MQRPISKLSQLIEVLSSIKNVQYEYMRRFFRKEVYQYANSERLPAEAAEQTVSLVTDEETWYILQ